MGLFSFTQEIAMDLGTANTIITCNGKIVVDEPSVVALDKKNNKKHVMGLLVAALVVAASAGIGLSTGLFQSVQDMMSGFHFSSRTLISLVAMIALVIGIEKLILLILSFLKKGSGRASTLVTIVQSLVSYACAIVIICWGLSLLGVNVATIVASLGIIALIIGFGAESLIADVVTGFFMLFENQYNVGDILEINGFRGTVTSIGIRTTSITDLGGNVKIINNSNMKDILNRSNYTSRAVSTIDIPYETDLEEFEPLLPAMMQRIYDKHADKLRSVPKYLGVAELGASGITLKFVSESDENNVYSAQRAMNRELLVEFKKAGVEPPYPQMDVHQKQQ